MASYELVALDEATPQLLAPTASDIAVLVSSLLLPQVNDAAAPTLAFGNGNTGLFESSDDNLRVAIAGLAQIVFTSTSISGTSTNNAEMLHSRGLSFTVPAYSWIGDVTTGVCHGAVGTISLTAGAAESCRATATTFDAKLRFIRTSTDSITAGTTQTQAGATALTTDVNRITVCANLADVVGLPSAVVGSKCTIIHDGVNNAGVFPKESGDSIDGAAADAVDPNALVAGTTRTYECLTATVWETA